MKSGVRSGKLKNAMIRRSKRLLFRVFAAAFGIVIALTVAEIALRIGGYSSPQFYEADETLGYRLIPNLSGWYRKEGSSFVTINDDGFHDAERMVEKPSGVFRIAIIGDSFVEALQVGREASFANFITGDCEPFGGRRVEVLSFGVSGYGTAQELIMLREKVLRYSPNVVMLVMTTNNDISDNVRELKKAQIPYYVVNDGKVMLDDSFRNDSGFVARSSSVGGSGTWLENRLRVVQAIREVARKLRARGRHDRVDVEQRGKAAPVEIEVGVDSQVYRPPTDEIWHNAWLVTEALILEMRREVEHSGARFVVVTASNGVQVLPDMGQRTQFARMLGSDDLYYPDRRIAEFCHANSISAITLAPMLAEYAAQERVNLHGFDGNLGYGHWNELGHRIAGQIISRRLCEALK